MSGTIRKRMKRCNTCGAFVKYDGKETRPAHNPPHELVEFHFWKCNKCNERWHKGYSPDNIDHCLNCHLGNDISKCTCKEDN